MDIINRNLCRRLRLIKAVFFDLFFTLIYPHYSFDNEYDVIGLSSTEWEKYAENDTLYIERASGKIRTEKGIINRIVNIMPYKVDEEQKHKILERRQERMKRALLEVNNEILETLKILHERDIKIGLISNADIIDSKHWSESPLAKFFDSVVFSCNVGMLKPEVGIYNCAMKALNVMPKESIFVGDGGSNELYGAKKARMKTIFTEYLESKSEIRKEQIMISADFHVKSFDEILNYID